MCSVCGCGHDTVRFEDGRGRPHHDSPEPHDHSHTHHERTHLDDESVHLGHGTHDHDHGGSGPHDHDHHDHHDHACHCHDHSHSHGPMFSHSHPHIHPHDHVYDHDHDHDHDHAHDHVHGHSPDHGHFQSGHDHDSPAINPAGDAADRSLLNAAPAVPRILRLEQDLLAKNNHYAAMVRRRLGAAGIFAVNLMSSPGAGKTTLLVRTLAQFAGRIPAAVIEGDQQTTLDAERIRATGTPALQINTGQGCHLDAAMIATALDRLAPPESSLLLIENVGNLVCPAAFDLGEAARVVVVALTEGDDKPLKYPNMFAAADLVVINKVDLAPHLPADLERLTDAIRRINHRAGILRLSATTGAGLDRWCAWLEAGLAGQQALRADGRG